MQQKKPKDYVIATGKQYTVKQFVNLVLKELKMDYSWKGTGINSKCFIKGFKNKIVSVDKNYFRPLEVDTLLGNSSKAKRELKWKPSTNFKELVAEMMEHDLNEIK